MKNFRQLFYTGIFFMIANASLMAANPSSTVIKNGGNPEALSVAPSSFVGSWDYTVADVPYEYSTGVLHITKENEKYVVKVKLQYNTTEATEVSLDKNTMNFSIWVEGEKIAVSLEIKEGALIGKANSSIGQLSLAGKRSKS